MNHIKDQRTWANQYDIYFGGALLVGALGGPCPLDLLNPTLLLLIKLTRTIGNQVNRIRPQVNAAYLQISVE